jgi:hypothetical protein
MSANTHNNNERLSPAAGSGKLVEVAEELRRMASVLGSTIEGRVCDLAADIVRQSGKQAMLLRSAIDALEAADECLALIEDVGHGAMSDNVTVARGIVLAALSQNDEMRDAKGEIKL